MKARANPTQRMASTYFRRNGGREEEALPRAGLLALISPFLLGDRSEGSLVGEAVDGICPG